LNVFIFKTINHFAHWFKAALSLLKFDQRNDSHSTTTQAAINESNTFDLKSKNYYCHQWN